MTGTDRPSDAMLACLPDGITLERLPAPARLADAGGARVREWAQLLNDSVRETWGHDDFVRSPERILETLRDSDQARLEGWLALEHDRIVGWWSMRLPLVEMRQKVFGSVRVVAEHRGRGLGSRLVDALEQRARELDRPLIQTYTVQAVDDGIVPEPHLVPTTGDGVVWADLPGNRLCVRHGYALEQVARASVLVVADADPHAFDADARAAIAGYRLVQWQGACPEQWVDDYALMHGRMSTDVPWGGLEHEESHVDAARVRAWEAEGARGGDVPFVTAAIDERTGRMAAFTMIEWNPETPAKADQEDTLVLSEHRGQRLGMIVKLANLAHLTDAHPEVARIYTWNASENTHMLAINTALGFRLAAPSGEWQKRLR